MRRAVILACLALLIGGCVSPAPFQSPATFDSPLSALQRRVYLPMVAKPALPKRGVSLACGYEDMARMEREVAELGASWIWNWQPDPPTFPGIESVPTIWDASFIGRALGGNSAWVIGPNECEQSDQCNTSPEDMARAWPRLVATYPGRKYGSPQVVQPHEHWLERFYAAYQAQNNGEPPPMDAIMVHTYWGNNIEDYKRQVLYYIDLAARWGVPEVWVTEFAFAPMLDGTVREATADLAAYVAWLDAQPTVTRYSVWTNRVECPPLVQPNGPFDTPLYAASGILTAAGRAYARQRVELP